MRRTVARNQRFEWPDLQVPRWKTQGLCYQAKLTPEQAMKLFFPQENTGQAKLTKQICAKCPVQKRCLQEALDKGEYGIWGGTTHEERIRMKRNMKRRVGYEGTVPAMRKPDGSH